MLGGGGEGEGGLRDHVAMLLRYLHFSNHEVQLSLCAGLVAG